MAWKTKVNELMTKHGGQRVNGKVASHKTQKATKEVLYNFFGTLHEIDLMIHEPKNVGQRHIKAAVRHWYFVRKLSPKTLQLYLSRLRVVFEHWLGKPGMVPHVSAFFPEVDPKVFVVKTTAEKSKSWAAAGIDVLAKLREADAMNPRLGMMLRMQLAFGLRRKEALLCRPWVADRGDVLRVYPGEGKGNRPRDIPIETQVQRALLKEIQGRTKKTEALGWPVTPRGKAATFEYQEKRYSSLMARLGLTLIDSGVTGHGLRAEYAENSALLQDFVPPTLGGTAKQMDKESLTVKKLVVSEALGHSRESVTSAYYGSESRRNADINPTHFQDAIAQGRKALAAAGNLVIPPTEVLEDCAKLMVEAAMGGISLLLEEVYALWMLHSLRWGTEWIAPTTGIRAALEAAANAACRLAEKAEATVV